MKKLLSLLTAFLLLTSFALSDLPKEFVELLDRAKMEFTEPAGYKQTKPIENGQMNWELAYKHPGKRLEVRYAIRPMDDLLKQYKESESTKKEGDIYIHPNQWYKSVFEATVLNISGGQLPEYSIFDKSAVKKEFNADWGATVGVLAGKEFGQDYKFCLFVFIHKDNLGDGYIFYLYDDKEVLHDEMMPIFHCLKFR